MSLHIISYRLMNLEQRMNEILVFFSIVIQIESDWILYWFITCSGNINDK